MSDPKITYRITCKVWGATNEDNRWGTGEGDTIEEAVRAAAVALQSQVAELELERRRLTPAIAQLEEWLHS